MTTQLVLTEAANVHKREKCPMRAADYKWKWFNYSVKYLSSFQTYVGTLCWTFLSFRNWRWWLCSRPGFIFIPLSEKSDGTDLTNESEAKQPFDW